MAVAHHDIKVLFGTCTFNSTFVHVLLKWSRFTLVKSLYDGPIPEAIAVRHKSMRAIPSPQTRNTCLRFEFMIFLGFYETRFFLEFIDFS